MRRLIVLVAVLLAACASAPPPAALPEFRVAPADYGRALTLQQRLRVEELDLPSSADRPTQGVRELDALLQLDAQQLRLVALSLSTRVLTLIWDGAQLQVQRHPMLPAVVDPARVLRDIALVYAPLPALRAGLPAGWRLELEDGERVLYQDAAVRLRVQYRDGGRAVEIDNRAEHYRLRIESRAQEAGE